MMRYLKFNSAVIIAFFSFLVMSFAQIHLENWQTYTSMLDSKISAVDSKGRIWVGSVGGVYVLDPSDSSFQIFNNQNGLYSINITCIKADKINKKIYLGGFDGNIDIVTEDFVWNHIGDIKNTKFPEPQINDILFDGDYAFIAGGFGLSVFDINKNVFLKTPPRLGSFPPNTGIKRMLKNGDELWVTSKIGIAKINLTKSIVNPDNWVNYTTKNGLKDNDSYFLTSFNDNIYVTAGKTIYKFQNDSFKLHFSYENEPYKIFKSLFVYKNRLAFSTQDMLQYDNYDVIYDKNSIADSSFINSICFDSDNLIVINLTENGILLFTQTGLKQFKPNTPLTSTVSGLSVDKDGSLWVTRGTDAKNILRKSGDKWSFYDNKINPNFYFNYFKTFASASSDVYCSSWGFGVLKVKTEGAVSTFSTYDHSNSPFSGASGNPNYPVIGQITEDLRNNMIWMVNYAKNSNGPLLVGQDPLGTFYSFENYYSPTNRDYMFVAVDQNGTKWLGSDGSSGLYYFNEMGTFDKITDDKYGTFSSSNSNLPNNTISALAVDKTGIIWVGTPSGLAVILSPGSVLRNGNPYIRKVTIMSQIGVNDIMVDALNYKWIATNEGIWVINPDGTEVIGNFNTKNSPMISDEITALANDPNSGTIYLGTKLGINSVSTLSINPLPEFKLNIYPQPFNPVTDEVLIIEGLTEDTDLSIITVNGELVKNITTTSRKAIWDGRNTRGEVASDGIYLIVASSGSKEATTIGKFAIIK